MVISQTSGCFRLFAIVTILMPLLISIHFIMLAYGQQPLPPSSATTNTSIPALRITKFLSPENISWGETATISISIQNTGQANITNVRVHDFIPNEFNFQPEGMFVNTENQQLNVTIETLGPGREHWISYTIKGADPNMLEIRDFTFPPAQASFLTSSGQQIGPVYSNTIRTTISTANYSEMLATVYWPHITAGMLIAAFVFGGIGAAVNYLSTGATRGSSTRLHVTLKPDDKYYLDIEYADYSKMGVPYKVSCRTKKLDATAPDVYFTVGFRGMVETTAMSEYRLECNSTEENHRELTFNPSNQVMHILETRLEDSSMNVKTERAVYVGKRKLIYDFYIGGIAGIITLISLEGISLLFTERFFLLNAQNIITLIGSSLLAGFIPQKIIDNATESLVNKTRYYQFAAATSEVKEAETSRRNAYLESENNLKESGMDSMKAAADAKESLLKEDYSKLKDDYDELRGKLTQAEAKLKAGAAAS